MFTPIPLAVRISYLPTGSAPDKSYVSKIAYNTMRSIFHDPSVDEEYFPNAVVLLDDGEVAFFDHDVAEVYYNLDPENERYKFCWYHISDYDYLKDRKKLARKLMTLAKADSTSASKLEANTIAWLNTKPFPKWLITSTPLKDRLITVLD